MKFIHKERQTGKTTELIELASREGGYIVCHNRHEAYRISKVAEESGKPILFPLTYDEYLSGAFCRVLLPFLLITTLYFILFFSGVLHNVILPFLGGK